MSTAMLEATETRAEKIDLPRLDTDLLLMHAPAHFDFRNREDIYFPFLGTSGDVPITPLYEYFPVGFKTLQRHLQGRGHTVKLINLSTVLLRYPRIDVDMLLRSINAKIIGIDLHWMVHVQGSLGVAKRIKEIRPDIKTIFGGISSTYFADQLIQYPFVDMVMRGYDTHVPMDALLTAFRDGKKPTSVANLLWKDDSGAIQDNDFSHLPDTFSCGIDWSQQPAAPKSAALPIREVLSTQNAGCAYNCGWCGGSRDAFRRINKRKRAMARKDPAEIAFEMNTLKPFTEKDSYHFYSVGSYNEPSSGMHRFLDFVQDTPLRSISYEQYHLTPDDILERMAQSNKRTIITLSPESSALNVAKLAGRGVYTNAEMEDWIEKALDMGIYHIDIWYFIGMPEQDEKCVMENVDYCEHLLQKFKGKNVNPMLCPMIPFLDPASTFFEYPTENGYRTFFRTVEEHRAGMENASIINRINYETRWLSRADLVYVGFEAVRKLMQAKAAHSALPHAVVRDYVAKIDDAVDMIRAVHEIDCLEDKATRARELRALGPSILERNNEVLFGGVMNQAFPINRDIGGRWFEELGWSPDELDAAVGH